MLLFSSNNYLWVILHRHCIPGIHRFYVETAGKQRKTTALFIRPTSSNFVNGNIGKIGKNRYTGIVR